MHPSFLKLQCMVTILTMYNRIKAFDTDKAAADSIENTKDDLLTKNNEQTYDGKDNTGNDITPNYFNDPFFKTPEQAKAYSEWKDRITPNSKRGKGVPNLFINGYYYRSRGIKVRGANIDHLTKTPEGIDIEQKFKNVRGLGGPYKVAYLNENLRPEFMRIVHKETGL